MHHHSTNHGPIIVKRARVRGTAVEPAVFDLQKQIREFIVAYNDDPKPFVLGRGQPSLRRYTATVWQPV